MTDIAGTTRRYESGWNEAAGVRMVRASGRWELPHQVVPVFTADPTFKHEPCTSLYDLREARLFTSLGGLAETIRRADEAAIPEFGDRHAYLVSDPTTGAIVSMMVRQREHPTPTATFTDLDDALEFVGVDHATYLRTTSMLVVRFEGDDSPPAR